MEHRLIWLAPVLSAAMLCLGLAEAWAWSLGWLALWPMFWALESSPDWRRRAALGGLWLLAIAQFGFPYAVSTASAYLGGGAGQLLLAWLMGTSLGVVTSLRYLAFSLLAHPGGSILYWASLWCLGELLIWQMMPVYGVIHVQGDFALLQWCELLGAPGVTWLWFYLSLALYRSRRGPSQFACWVAIWGLVHLLGWQRAQAWDQLMTHWNHGSIGIVQANHPPALPREQAQDRLQHMIGLSQLLRRPLGPPRPQDLGEAVHLLKEPLRLPLGPPRPQVICWPEASLPLVELSRLGGVQLKTPLICSDYEPGQQGGYVLARSLDAEGKSLASYRKRKLILMGEWTPWDKNHSLEVGQEDQLLPTPLGPALPLICFEGLWPDFVAGFHRRTQFKATWLVHLASEASFSSPLACRQSLELTRLRCLELRLPMLRADNSGISGWIDGLGRVHQASQPFTTQVQTVEFRFPHPRTQGTGYARWGNLPLWVLILIGLMPFPRAPRKGL